MGRPTLLLALALTLAGCGPESAADPAAAASGPHAEAGLRPTLTTVATYGADTHRRLVLWAMGTEVVVEAVGPGGSQQDAALLAAEEEFRRVEDLCTSWRDSPLTRMNGHAGSGPVSIPAELARLIGRGLDLGAATDGAFDVTFAGVGKLWDFQAEPPVLPSEGELAAALAAVDYRRVKLNLEASTIALPAGAAIGLGGIAKGYGVDRALAVLVEHGVEHGLVNAGGDLKVLGTKDGQPWKVAIRHPRDRDELLEVVPLTDLAAVTSGDYERFFEHEGRRYHHILDPRTGYPATGAMSVTVVAPDAAFADALATALAVLGPEDSLPIVEALEHVEALVVDLDGGVHRSSGLRE